MWPCSNDQRDSHKAVLLAMMSKAYVLYVDHKGHPAPLTEGFHATASRRLSSTVERHPPTTVTEVDSAYCPQCLSVHDAATAARIGFCSKPICQRCPLCQSVATVTAQDNKCYYACGGGGLCDWTSLECDLAVGLESSQEGSVDKLELARAAEELGSKLTRRREEPQAQLETFSTGLTRAWLQRSREQTDRKMPRKSRGAGDGPEGWSVEALELSIDAKKAQLSKGPTVPALEGLVLQRISPDDPDVAGVDESMADIPVLSHQLQALNSVMLPTSRKNFLPLPMPLRVRKSRRCRAELAEGRPGILLKPKLNPLEGDSSLRTGHGQWWKKDSSAIHVIPRVRVLQHGTANGFHIFLLKVVNPTLGLVRLGFAASPYKGEPSWDDKTQSSSTMSTLLVDTLHQTHLNVMLDTETLQNLAPTDTVELLSAEDSIIELRGRARQTPPEVTDWKLESVKVEAVSLRVVAQSASDAWFELAMPDVSSEDDGMTCAVPLQLQVELGNGSWETSLIAQRPADNGETDKVAFDLVIAWQ